MFTLMIIDKWYKKLPLASGVGIHKIFATWIVVAWYNCICKICVQFQNQIAERVISRIYTFESPYIQVFISHNFFLIVRTYVSLVIKVLQLHHNLANRPNARPRIRSWPAKSIKLSLYEHHSNNYNKFPVFPLSWRSLLIRISCLYQRHSDDQRLMVYCKCTNT